MLGISDADSGEHGSESGHLVITPVACALPNRPDGAPKLFGMDRVRLAAGSVAHEIYQQDEIREEYFCNYEVNPRYASRLEAAGLRAVAWGPQGEVRAVELPGHRFFLATLFQPQLSSLPEKPHPVILAYLKAAQTFREERAHERKTVGVP